MALGIRPGLQKEDLAMIPRSNENPEKENALGYQGEKGHCGGLSKNVPHSLKAWSTGSGDI